MGHEFNMEVIFLKIICLVLVTVNCAATSTPLFLLSTL